MLQREVVGNVQDDIKFFFLTYFDKIMDNEKQLSKAQIIEKIRNLRDLIDRSSVSTFVYKKTFQIKPIEPF